ncbi:hypothetical protein J7K05_00465, partial [bacterium]|nr:hypothetical protein [bacterium]
PQPPTSPLQPPSKKANFKMWGKIIAFFLGGLIILGALICFFRLPVKVSVSPSAVLYLDENNKGEISQKTFWIKPGNHTLRLQKTGFQPEIISFYQPYWSLKKFAFKLKKAPALQEIDQGTEAFLRLENDKNYLLYFNPEKKAFFRYNLKTKEKIQITPAYFWNLQKIKWNESGTGVVVWLQYDNQKFKNTPFYQKTLTNQDIATYYYDFKRYKITEQNAYFWGKDINEIAWAPVKGRFYYLGGQANKGYLAQAEHNAQKITRLLTNIPATGELKVNSTETSAYMIGRPFETKFFEIDLTDPARELEALTEQGKTNFVWLNDNQVLIGSLQGNPKFRSSEKFQLFDLSEEIFKGQEFYAQKGWFYQLKDGFIVLEAKENLWIIHKITTNNQEEWRYEYISSMLPEKIWYHEKESLLFVESNNQIFSLIINHG